MNKWQGKFGDDYTKRNTPDVNVRYSVFKRILSGINVNSIFEVGCNKGINMYALQVLYPLADIMGNDINRKILKSKGAFKIIKGISKKELIFTCGVLIHTSPKELPQTMKNIIKSSRRYILAIEYYAPKETMITYRGNKDMLWKRPYGKLYSDLGLKLIKTGKAKEIDNCTYWLFKK